VECNGHGIIKVLPQLYPSVQVKLWKSSERRCPGWGNNPALLQYKSSG